LVNQRWEEPGDKVKPPSLVWRWDDKNRMTGDCHVRIRGSVGVKFPRATRLTNFYYCPPLNSCRYNAQNQIVGAGVKASAFFIYGQYFIDIHERLNYELYIKFLKEKKMKLIKQTIVLVFVALMIQCLFVGCSSTPSKPSYHEIEKAVKSKLEQPNMNDKERWLHISNASYCNLKITTLRIKEWGSFNEQQRYWPVKIRIAGNANFCVNEHWKQDIDHIFDFMVKKDDHGKWEAILKQGG
jgi:hypothetical protein